MIVLHYCELKPSMYVIDGNEAFLDDGINAGKTFQFSHNPLNDTGSLGKEYQYLLQNNYIWDDITMTMSPLY